MLVMLGGPYPRRVLFRQTRSLQVKLLCVCVSVSSAYCMSACAYVFVQGSISPLLVHCGPHLAFRTSSSSRFSKEIFRPGPNAQIVTQVLIHILYFINLDPYAKTLHEQIQRLKMKYVFGCCCCCCWTDPQHLLSVC